MVDNRAGALAATEHLINSGAKRVVCITGPARASTAAERLLGYRAALRKAGREPVPDLVRHADFRGEGDYATAATCSRGGARCTVRHQRPDDVDALQAIADLRLRCPPTSPSSAFDDAPSATLTTPPLTVVAQPTLEIGREAARLLTTASEGLATRHVVLAPTHHRCARAPSSLASASTVRWREV